MDNAEALTDSAKASSAKGMKKEYSALIVAALILLIVLIAVFMCLQLFYMRKPASSTPRGFRASLQGPGVAMATTAAMPATHAMG
jgi:flagellar basal body-associated protein FliL